MKTLWVYLHSSHFTAALLGWQVAFSLVTTLLGEWISIFLWATVPIFWWAQNRRIAYEVRMIAKNHEYFS